jgi:galactose mutarotase-like enzyme
MENEFLRATINPLGAELISLYNKKTNEEIIWQADKAIWGRHAPVLFPVVGKLKDDHYVYLDKRYQLCQHGFARDLEHTMISENEYELKSSEITKKHFPFDFILKTFYRLEKNFIHITYRVENHGDEIMPFSIGAHPGFALTGNAPLRVEFEHKEAGVYRLKNGLVDFSNANRAELVWNLKDENFKNDAMIFKNLKSKWVKLYEEDLLVTLHFQNIPFFGMWAKPNLPFLCLEPWWGIADTTLSSGNIMEKVGIQALAAHTYEEYTYSIEVNI